MSLMLLVGINTCIDIGQYPGASPWKYNVEAIDIQEWKPFEHNYQDLANTSERNDLYFVNEKL